jgi:GT2 family glycosyltransferase
MDQHAKAAPAPSLCDAHAPMPTPMTPPTSRSPAVAAAPEPAVDRDPSVSVIVPVRNERDFIETCVGALQRQRDLPARFEIVVVDGMSDDGTREVLAKIAAADPRVRVIDNPRRIVSTALNLGIAQTTSDILIRVDGHTRVFDDFVRANLELLREHPEAWSVGGPIAHRGDNDAARGIALAMGSRFGSGGARHRLDDYEGYAEGAVFPALRREIFAKIGTFDEGLVRNQDDEFNFRVTEAGGKIYISPRVRHDYFVRARLDALFRQYLQYAYWKVEVMRKHGKVVALRHLVPAAFVVGAPACAGLAVTLPFPLNAAAAAPLAAYATALTGYTLSVLAKTRSPRVAAVAGAAAVTMHVAYGLGTLVGLVAPPGRSGNAIQRMMERVTR